MSASPDLREPPDSPDASPGKRPAPRRAFVAPLLGPAVGLCAGIAVAEWIAPRAQLCGSPGGRALLWIAPALPLLAWLGHWFVQWWEGKALATDRAARSGGALPLVLVATAALCGFSRHQVVLWQPPDSVARVAGDERELVRLRGRVISVPISLPPEVRNPHVRLAPSCTTRFLVQLLDAPGDPPAPIRGTASVTVLGEPAGGALPELGQCVVLAGWLRAPRGRRNPGEPDWAEWHRLQGVQATLLVENWGHVAREPAPGWVIGRWLAQLRSAARGMLFESAAAEDESTRLLDALLLGQRSRVSRRLDDAFQRTGLVHILSVSGFHLGVLAGFTYLVLRRILRLGRRVVALAVIAVTLCYVAMAEPGAPILRAAVMAVLACAAALLRRPFSALNWLSASALAILLYNPLELFRAGFQLSFLQVLGLIVLVPRADALIRSWRGGRAGAAPRPRDAHSIGAMIGRAALRAGGAAIVASVVAWAVSVPLVLHHFGLFTPLAAIQTLLLSPLFSLVIIAGFVTLLLRAIGAPLGDVAVVWLHDATNWLMAAVERLAGMPGTLVHVESPPGLLVLATYAAPAWLLAWRLPKARGAAPRARYFAFRRGATWRFAPPALVALFWIVWLAGLSGARRGGWTIAALDVGHGSACVIVSPAGAAAVFDCGTDANFDVGLVVEQAARRLGVVRVEFLALSHDDFDHYSGASSLIAAAGIPRVVAPQNFGEKRLRAFVPGDVPIERPMAGDRLALRDATWEVLWPRGDLPERTGENDTSLVVRARCGAVTILLTGDIEQAGMAGLLEAQAAGECDLKSDILIAPHHGSVLPLATEAFYRAVAPRIVVVSSREARPAVERLVRRAAGAGAVTLNTHECGAIVLRAAAGGDVPIETMRGPLAR